MFKSRFRILTNFRWKLRDFSVELFLSFVQKLRKKFTCFGQLHKLWKLSYLKCQMFGYIKSFICKNMRKNWSSLKLVSSKSENFSLLLFVIISLYQLQYSPAGSRKSGDVNDTFTVMLPSVTNTAPSTGAIVTLYLCSSETFLSWSGNSLTTRFRTVDVGFSAQSTTNCTMLSPCKSRPEEIWHD